MIAPVRAWNAFWFQPVSARPLGVFRILIGVLTLAHLAMIAVDLDYWLTDQGILTGTEARELAGPLRFSPLQYVQDPVSVSVFVAATAGVAALFTLGWRTRLMSILLYGGMLSIHHRNIPTNCGPDNLLIIFLFCLMLSPCGAAYSLDARRLARRRGTVAEPIIIPWAQRLIQWQMALIYFNTAILKCHGSTWLDGTSLHYILNNPEVIRFPLTGLSRFPVLLNMLSSSALILELSLPFLIWFRPTRGWVIAGGLAMHGGIMLMINVPLFGELTTACYLLFLTPEEFAALTRIVNPWRWSSHATTEAAQRPDRVDPAQAARGPHAVGYARTKKNRSRS